MKNATPIIAFANTPWTASLWMNRQHLLSRLAQRGRKVAYSNGVVHYREWDSGLWLQQAAHHDQVLVMQPGYFIPATHRPSWLRTAALAHHCRRIRALLGLGRAAPVVGLCFDPDLLDYVDALAPVLRVFHIYDSYNKMDNRGVDFDPVRARLREFDLVTASSAYMYEDVIGRTPTPDHVVPNGVDYEGLIANLDLQCPTATAIRALPGPRVGYVGSINTKVDFELVHALASARPDASFVFVGPVRNAILHRNPADRSAFERLRALPNVHIFRQVPRHELAPVLAAMDMNCIFFRLDRHDWVEAVYPLKLNEYLAVGKPVLSTPLRIVREQFTGVVAVCDGQAEWLAAIDAAHAESGTAAAVAARRAIAAANDWNVRVTQFAALIDDALQ